MRRIDSRDNRYTAGVFGLLRIGHLNSLKNAKGICERLVVGVTMDELV